MAHRIDLTNQIFGHWKALYPAGKGYWHCLCDCGNEKDVLARSLITGKSISCGHLNKGPQKENLTGKQIGEWTVLEYAGNGKYRCKCSCDKEKLVSAYLLLNNLSKSCGHGTTGFKDLMGENFGEWTVIEYAGNQHWTCRCSCGTIRDVATTSLINKLSTNCGCKNRIELTNKKIGSLTVIKRSDTDSSFWVCRCSCGKTKEIRGRLLITGSIRSCGCKTTELKRETMLERYGDIAVSRINNPRSIAAQNATISSKELEKLLNEGEKLKGNELTLKEVATMLDIVESKASIHLKEFGLENRVKYGTFGDEENQLISLIESFGYKVERHNREIIKPYELDIYIPELRIAIEFNGTYWHKEDYRGKTYHQEKTIRCIHQRVRLIHIFEYEWVNNKDKIETYLCNILSKDKQRIYARSTELREISRSEAAEFEDANHLQGRAQSSVNIALYYNNEIVSLITFGKPRFNSEYQWELIRLAHKKSTIVIGGSQRLFRYFIDKYKPESIQSYCDAAKFIGDVYFKLGFKLDNPFISDPNYVWVDKHNKNIYKRYQTQKHKLLRAGLGDKGDTEVEIMENLGYTRVFDSGNYRFVWKRGSQDTQ